MNTPYVFKKCNECGKWKVANRKRFNRKKGLKYDIKDTCRDCLITARKIKRTTGISGKVFRFNNCVKFRHRAKIRKYVNKITVEEFEDMVNFFNYTDAYSGELLTLDEITLDHIIPLSSNGKNTIWNLLPASQKNNENKSCNNMEE